MDLDIRKYCCFSNSCFEKYLIKSEMNLKQLTAAHNHGTGIVTSRDIYYEGLHAHCL